jgi:cytochrome c heme-lyase
MPPSIFNAPEQQYFNAMKRKGYNPPEEDISVIVAIHNIVNEQGWSKVQEWESLRGCEKPKLKQFLGRPKDISPKAYLLNLFG